MNAITTRQSTAVTPVLQPSSFGELVQFAKMAAMSDLAPKDYKGKPENIMLAVQMGSEVGLSPMQSLQGIAVINGKPGLYGDAMIGLVRGSPLCEDIIETIEGEGDHLTAICTVKRRGSSPVAARFSVADAKKAGLWGKGGPWTQYPERMLKFRARGFALRDAFPDVLKGLKTVEELRDYPGTTIDAEPVQHQAPAPAPAKSLREELNDSIPMLDDAPPPPPAKQEGLRARLAKCQTVQDVLVVGDWWGRTVADMKSAGKHVTEEMEAEGRDLIAARYGDLQEAAEPVA